MSPRFAVVTNTDGYMRCFGTFRSAEAAEAFAEKVNARVEKDEAKEFEEWDNRDRSGESGFELAPEGYGRAHVLSIRAPRVLTAVKAAEGSYDL